MFGYRLQTGISWAIVILIFLSTEYAIFAANIFWVIMGFWALCIAILPAVMSRALARILPFELLLLIAIPFFLYFLPGIFNIHHPLLVENLMRASQVMVTFLIGFVTVIDIHTYTSVKMNMVFAIAFTVMLTMTLSSFFAIADFVSDEFFGTHALPSNAYLMLNLLYSFGGGIFMGAMLAIYLRKTSPERLRRFGIDRGDRR